MGSPAGTSAESDLSPSQKPGAEHCPDEGAKDDGATIPDYDKRDGSTGMVKREDRGAQCSRDESCNRTGQRQIGRRLLSQSPDKGGERRDGDERDANQTGGPLRSEDQTTPGSWSGEDERDNARRENRAE